MAQRIILYGGSFNPPTIAHEAIIRACLALPGFDEVWVMPSRTREDKEITVSDDNRLQMLYILQQYAFAGERRLKITDFELKLPAPTRTARTLPALAAAYPGTEFWLALGGDSYRSLPEWPDAASFMHDIRVVLFSEDGEGLAENDHLVHLHLPQEVWTVSSTEARALLSAGQDARAVVRQPVLDYIARHHLY
ncbi:MAG TPA: nicotinate-nicotinamide nucleotide adenylyltransferase [Candidatus Saccharimonadales bacterium]|nr:nicotinate-nicotinamide nucleotide adenylyltransferase [Candidatus Saccharimonadales bacterium]